jgi:hypothetical protein
LLSVLLLLPLLPWSVNKAGLAAVPVDCMPPLVWLLLLLLLCLVLLVWWWGLLQLVPLLLLRRLGLKALPLLLLPPLPLNSTIISLGSVPRP